MHQTRHQRVLPPAKNFFERLTSIGLLSLVSLFIGSFILIFVACNALSTHISPVRGPNPDFPGDLPGGVFRFGMRLSVQVWIAIVGVGFGLNSYGLLEAYDHIFDAWCSRQAKSHPGLSYAKYLNSQPRAPIILGTQGFPISINLRRFLKLLTIGASVGYKFGIVNDDRYAVNDEKTLSSKESEHVVDCMPSALVHSYPSLFSAWMVDGVQFLQHYNGDDEATESPQNVMMTKKCTVNHEEVPVSYTLENVVVSGLIEETGSYKMTRNASGWHRAQSTGLHWITKGNQSSVVVDYRILEPDAIQIQWAPNGNWYSNNNTNENTPNEEDVVQRLTYRMYPAVAVVGRARSYIRNMPSDYLLKAPTREFAQFKFSSTRFNDFLDLVVSTNTTPLTFESELLNNAQPWIEAFLNTSSITMPRAVSAFVRAAMSHTVMSPIASGYLSSIIDETEFGNQIALLLDELPPLPYIRIGNPWNATGCTTAAIVVYLLVGILAFLTGIFRIVLGPPALTSWMGQHVSMMLGDTVTMRADPKGLHSGYEVVSPELGNLWLPTDSRTLNDRQRASIMENESIVATSSERNDRND